MRLSVVIVNWNSRQDLLACLASLASQTAADRLEVVVVDNGSADGSAAAVREQYPSYIVLELAENLGFAEGSNRGISATTGDWVALLNNDTVADPHWAETLIAAAKTAPAECGMLQSVLLFMDRPGEINSTGIVLTSSGSGNDRDEGEPFGDVEATEIFCPTAGACAYRRAMLDSIRLPVGFFDRDHFMYFEDLDLGWRARLAGWTARLVPSSLVLHKYQGSAVRHGREWMTTVSHINRLRTLVKNASPSFIARTIPRTAKELARLGRIGGSAALIEAGSAVATSIRHRTTVTAMARVSRESIERRWVDRRALPIETAPALRLGFVVQRYGREVNGGAELHCRELAEHLARRPEVEEVRVLTTCARSHETWENHYTPGEENINGVTVERYEVAFPRYLNQQARIENLIAHKSVPSSRPLQHAWLLTQGPFSPSLLARIRAVRNRFDALIFFTYLYSPTVHGLRLAPERAILVPTAHDEPAIRMEIFRRVFSAPRALAFNTPEERDFVRAHFDIEGTASEVVGCGVAIDAEPPPLAEATKVVSDPYILYLGRLEAGKGLGELLAGFFAFKARRGAETFRARGSTFRGNKLKLVLAGTGNWAEIPAHPDIIRTGFVDDAVKNALLAHAEIVAVPSRYESLSLVLLEAWAAGRAAIVSADCAVTSGMVARTGGGTSFRTPTEFADRIATLLADERARETAGSAGRAFVRKTYAWPSVEDRMLGLARRVAEDQPLRTRRR